MDQLEDTPGNDLAQTGSLVHLGISVYHQTVGADKQKKGAKAIEAGRKLYPLADVQKALQMFHKYPAKFATQAPGKVKLVETEVKFDLPYTTKEKVSMTGHVDLVCENDLGIYVIDHKSGPSPADYLLRMYPPQIAGYMYGIWIYLKKPKKPIYGRISRLQDLHRTSADFYYDIGFGLDGAMLLLQQAAMLLELHIPVSTPGKHCDWCELNHPQCFLTPEGTGGKKAATHKRRELILIDELFKG